MIWQVGKRRVVGISPNARELDSHSEFQRRTKSGVVVPEQSSARDQNRNAEGDRVIERAARSQYQPSRQQDSDRRRGVAKKR